MYTSSCRWLYREIINSCKSERFKTWLCFLRESSPPLNKRINDTKRPRTDISVLVLFLIFVHATPTACVQTRFTPWTSVNTVPQDPSQDRSILVFSLFFSFFFFRRSLLLFFLFLVLSHSLTTTREKKHNGIKITGSQLSRNVCYVTQRGLGMEFGIELDLGIKYRRGTSKRNDRESKDSLEELAAMQRYTNYRTNFPRFSPSVVINYHR